MKGLIVVVCFLFVLNSGESTTEAPQTTEAPDNGNTIAGVSTTTIGTTVTTAAPCVDTIPNCQQYLAQCTVPAYQQLMYEKCRKTCNLCNACLDSDDRCPTWAGQGFCTNPFYQTIWKECSKSCNLCT